MYCVMKLLLELHCQTLQELDIMSHNIPRLALDFTIAINQDTMPKPIGNSIPIQVLLQLPRLLDFILASGPQLCQGCCDATN